METIEEIFRREDVRFYMRKKEAAYRYRYKTYYATRLMYFHSDYARNFVFHKAAFIAMRHKYDMTEAEFEILMSHKLMGEMWDVNNYSGVNSVYVEFFEGRMSRSQYMSRMARLRKKGFLIGVPAHKQSVIHKGLLRAVKSPNEKIIKFSAAGIMAVNLYNRTMSQVIREKSMRRPNILRKIKNELTTIITLVKNLASGDDKLKNEINELLKHE